MVSGLEIPFDRVTYRDGQLLTAADLIADQSRNARLWALHTRYLHDTWGIAIGYLVNAGVGDTLVQVTPGYAVDDQGRPLLSSQTVPVPLPLIAGTAHTVLVINFQDDASYSERAELNGLCPGTSNNDLESPLFLWKDPADVQMGTDIPLITVQVSAGAVQSTDTRARRYVQKMVRPYIASGATDAGYTQWSQISGAAPDGFTFYRTVIDTSDSSFINVPYYFAELHMGNGAPAQIYGFTNFGSNPDMGDFGGPFTFMQNVSRTSFTFNLIVPSADKSTAPDPNKSQWTVSWVGIELAQCVPHFNWLTNILLNFPFRFPFLLGKLGRIQMPGK
jgi:hypothetical protein